ncbi:hypothetical protein BDK92_2080 [Micromonospora pisi]|uniref:Uncharacterized protein n=1 Tax=Micromonospora pisi TaxID=589240 RepID=A0A495JFW7_9ACTN|nr:hypothetical protein BDK92_2080 [Micromonospora pisi]
MQVQQLEQGAAQALIAQKPSKIGVTGVKNMLAALTGGGEKVGTGTVTRDNPNTPEIQQALYQSKC